MAPTAKLPPERLELTATLQGKPTVYEMKKESTTKKSDAGVQRGASALSSKQQTTIMNEHERALSPTTQASSKMKSSPESPTSILDKSFLNPAQAEYSSLHKIFQDQDDEAFFTYDDSDVEDEGEPFSTIRASTEEDLFGLEFVKDE